MDKVAFYKNIRASLFNGVLGGKQVEGMEAILDFWLAPIPTDKISGDAFLTEWDKKTTPWLAYALATTFHETAFTMQPVVEYGGVRYFDKYDTGRLARMLGNTPEADGDGYKYRGRGFVQLTGRSNYNKMGNVLIKYGYTTESLLDTPELATDMELATVIMFYGMTTGLFTGKKFSDYLSSGSGTNAYRNARRIINGKDKAQRIATYANKFSSALQTAVIKE